ncbi:MAG: hypothetical protein Q9163_005114, partial [Psora crenata]
MSTEPEEPAIYYLEKVAQQTQKTRADEAPLHPPALPPPSILAGQRPRLPPLRDLHLGASPQQPHGQPQPGNLPERNPVQYTQQTLYPQPLPPPDSGARWQPPPPPQGHGGPVSSFPPVALYPQKASFQSRNPGTVYEALSPVQYSTQGTGGPPSILGEAAYNHQNPYQAMPMSTFQSAAESYRSSTTSSSRPESAQGSVQYPQPPPAMGPAGAEPATPSSPMFEIQRYILTIRQQPIAARACGFGERDRRVIDPPPIIQLSLRDFDPHSPSDVAELQYPFNIHYYYYHGPVPAPAPALPPPSTLDVTAVSDPNQAQRTTRRLMGTLVASPFVGRDPETPLSTFFSSSPASAKASANLATFFIFPDLSCRQNGHYRLRFTLMRVPVGMNVPEGGQGRICGSIDSDVFEVFSAKDFPGMRASTLLTRELKRQGAGISVKKGKGFVGSGAAEDRKRDSSDNDSGEDGCDDGGGGDEAEADQAKGKGRPRKKR